MRDQLERTALLFLIAALCGLMWLFSAEKKELEQLEFYRIYWNSRDTLYINQLDSSTIALLPLSNTAKTSLDKRSKNRWYFSSTDQLKSIPGMDTLWLLAAKLNFDKPLPPARKKSPSYLEKPNSWESSKPRQPFAAIDINGCDSLALVAIPGIGPFTAKSILQLRSRWGSIRSLKQIQSIHGLAERWDSRWDSLITIVPPENGFNTLSLNKSSFSELKALPGMTYARVKRIVFFRETFGPLTWDEVGTWKDFEGLDLEILKLFLAE
jgi:DNA uptake protein ComE-like DNA-binding protein